MHTFNAAKDCTTSHKRIYYRLVYDKEGNQKAKEILTGYEFPTAYGIILGEYSNTENFVSGNAEVYDYEVDKYLKTILSDERIRQKEINEILFPKTKNMTSGKRRILK